MKTKATKAHTPVPAKKCVHTFKCMFNSDCEALAKAELSDMTAEELELKGRTYGIELDRRKLKATLVNELYEVM